ncbi:MAG: hypothetical protein SOY69_02775 [Alloprevotella sp.]|nr:hypothetical protein [Alloprevotella sp.]
MQIEATTPFVERETHTAATDWATDFPVWATEIPVAQTVPLKPRPIYPLANPHFYAFDTEILMNLTTYHLVL